MLQFSHPDYLTGLWSLPVLAVVFFFLSRWRFKLLSLFISPSLFKELAPARSGAKVAIKQGFLLAGLGFLIIALANPQVGTRVEEAKREGIDLFVTLDVSLSMKAEDIKPSRLEKAKRDISALLQKLEGDRVGLIVFAGDAFVQFPLTTDYSAADLFISAVDVDVVPTPGTMIPSAIELALKSFPAEIPSQKVIIVVTDGENTEGNTLKAVEAANKAGVKVFTVGIGTPEGGPIPIVNAQGERVDYKRDRAGNVVVTKLDETMLQQIATSTGGSYRRATSGGNEIDDIFKELATLEKVQFGTKEVTAFETKYQYPLALAILILLLELLLSERRGTVLAFLKRLVLAAPVLIVAVGVGNQDLHGQTHRSLIKHGNDAYERGKFTDAEVEYKKALQDRPGSPQAHYNLGDAYYKQDRHEEAIGSFGSYAMIAKTPGEKANGTYNLGNSLFKSDKLKESIEAYKQSLRLNPSDEEARYNLQLAKDRLKEQEQQKKNKKQEKENKENEDQKQNQNQDQKQKDEQQKDQNKKQEQGQPQQAQKSPIPKEQADRILEALRNNEKEVQRQLRKREGMRINVEKDW